MPNPEPVPVPLARLRICALGEGMLEMSRSGDGWRVGYGGDTINTAVHLARFGQAVSYASALGTDPLSHELRDAWSAEGIDTGPTLASPERLPGLYVIETDPAGERGFHYWRSESAARHMFDLPESDAMIETIAAADLLYYSLITLAILPDAARARLFDLCRRVRARGGRVAFDGNYRPRLWPDAATARSVRDQAVGCCDIGLPTLADEVAMGEADDAGATAARWRTLGAGEVIVKLGRDGCLADGRVVAPPPVDVVVDTSGAGDAFNAGYLDARLRGAPVAGAALAGHRLAGWVIGHRGAIPAPGDGEPYRRGD